MKKQQQKVHEIAKLIIQKMIKLEETEWPPSTPFAFYQPRRPLSTHEHSTNSVK